MSLETRLRNSGQQGGAGGGSPSNSGGLMGTGGLFVAWSSDTLASNEKVLTAGSSILVRTDATNIYIDATTGASASSAGLAGTGVFYLGTSANSTWPNWFVLTPGSSITTFTSGTNFVINAVTSTFAGSAGLMGTASFLVAWSSDPLISNEKVLTSGSTASVRTDATAIYIDASTAGLAFQSTQVNTTFPLSGGGDLSATRTHVVNTAFLVTSNRTINTTSPLGGGGNLGADLTLGVGSLTTIGSANQFIRVQTGGTAWDYINFRSGSSTTVSQGSGFIQIDANTGGAASSSAGLMGTASFLVTWSSDPLISNEKILTAGSSVTIVTDATAIYISAITGAGSSSSGLMGTGSFLVTWSADPLISNEKVLTAGSSVTLVTDATTIWINALTNAAAAGGNFNPHPYYHLLPQQAKLYASDSAARIDAGTPLWRLLYKADTQQYGIWQFYLPNDYSSSPTVRLLWGADSGLSVARSCTWIVDQWGWAPNIANSSSYVDTFGAVNSFSLALSAGYSSGTIQSLTIPLVNTVSMAGGNLIRLRVSASGGYVGNAELDGVVFDYIGQQANLNSAGLMGTGSFLVAWSGETALTNEKVLTAGSSVTVRTDATAIYIDANTANVPVNSGGLMSTGGLFVTWSTDVLAPNEKILTAGTGIILRTDGTTISIDEIVETQENYVNMRTGHMLGPFASVERSWYVGGCVNATALATAVIGINSGHMVPYRAARFIKVNSMGVNVTIAGSATAQIQLAIYTNSADECLFPLTCVSSSGFLTASNLQLVAYNPAITLTANNLYWFGYLITKSAVTMRTVAVGGAWGILGLNSGMGTAPGLGYQIFVNPSNGFATTMPGSGNVTTAAFPAIGIRGSI